MKRFSRPDREADSEPLFDGPSKSVLKREAHRAQALGEQLIALKDAELRALELPEALYEAIVAARSISSRGGGARQRQYIGKLMRDIDLTRVREALGAQGREVRPGGPAFPARRELACPVCWRAARRPWRRCRRPIRPWMRPQWLKRVAAAQTEARTGARAARAARELFRALRELLD